MPHLLRCECGTALPVTDGQAGSAVPCPCGRTVPVPALGELRLLPAVREEPAPGVRAAEFFRTLMTLTPRVIVTPALAGVNGLVFVGMVAAGVSPTDPTAEQLVRWGADFGPNTLAGEWWRLLACNYLHIGFLHLLLNMWALLTAGPMVERMLGNAGFLLLYLASGLAGSLASLGWNPMLVSAGASGAVFGVYGALLGLLLRGRGTVPTAALTQLRNGGLVFVGYNLVYGATQPNVDMAAHVGGLLAGFLGGLLLGRPFTPDAADGRAGRNGRFTAAAGVVLAVGLAGVCARHGGLVAVVGELKRFVAVEAKAIDDFNRAVEQAQKGELADAAFADRLDKDILPDWRAARQRLDAAGEVPAAYRQHVAGVKEYMRLRQEAWETLVRALRDGTEASAADARAKQQLADAAAQRVSK